VGALCLYSLNCTKVGQLILRKIIKIIAARCQILRLKCTKFDFGWGSTLHPVGGAYSASQTPYVDLRGPIRGKEGEGEGWGKGWERDGEGGEGEGRTEGRERKGMEEGIGKGDRGNGRDGT